MTIGESTMLDAAYGYVEGSPSWPIFPAHPKLKRPVIKTGTDHAEGASRDPDQIRQWLLYDFRECAIGMPTGAASGTVVIDADAKHDGERLLGVLERALGLLPRNRVVRTQSGGLHVYCKHPGNGIRVRTGAGDDSQLGLLLRGRAGVDVRADGGIVILPPSCGYKWIADDDEPLMPLPPRWLAAIQGAGDPPPPPPRPRPTRTPDREVVLQKAARYLAKIPGAVSGSGGHTATLEAAIALVCVFPALNAGDVYDLMAADYNHRCSPPWSEKDLRRKVAEAVKSRAATGRSS